MPTQRDLIQWLSNHLGRGKGSGTQRSYRCPFCLEKVGTESNKRKLNVNLKRGVAHCFRCGYSAGALKKLLHDVRGGLTDEEYALLDNESTATDTLDFRGAVYEHFFSKPDELQSQRSLKPIKLPDEALPLWKDTTNPLKRRAYRYLKKRGVTQRQIKRHRLYYAADGKYRNRVIFPVRQGGKTVYFTSRYTGNHELKSLNPKLIEDEDGNPTHHHADSCILNYDNLVGKQCIVLVEGPFDMLAFDNAGALLGKDISQLQLELIGTLVEQGTEEVIVALDAEAELEAKTLYEKLDQVAPKRSILHLPHGDPADHKGRLEPYFNSRGGPTLKNQLRSRALGVSSRRALT